jgi:hypothetical protein
MDPSAARGTEEKRLPMSALLAVVQSRWCQKEMVASGVKLLLKVEHVFTLSIKHHMW